MIQQHEIEMFNYKDVKDQFGNIEKEKDSIIIPCTFYQKEINESTDGEYDVLKKSVKLRCETELIKNYFEYNGTTFKVTDISQYNNIESFLNADEVDIDAINKIKD